MKMKFASEQETRLGKGSRTDQTQYRKWRTIGGALLSLLVLNAPVRNACSETLTATNASPITIPSSGTSGVANPYPSTIGFGGFDGTITFVQVTLHNISHTFPDDLDILLVGPGGQSTILMSDCGGDHTLNNVDLAFADSSSPLPDSAQIIANSYRPTNYASQGVATDPFPTIAGQSFAASLAVFNNTSPNGTWSLYVVDDAAGDIGAIAGGWTLTLRTTAFQNGGVVNIPGTGTSGPANPYPSTINVAGLPTSIRKVTVRLSNLSHTFPDDLDILLARPSGPNAIIMSDVGGGTNISNLTFTLDDAAATTLPDNGPLVAGTFRPTNIFDGNIDAFPAPAPVPTGGSLSVFNNGNPNGAWNLFVVDDTANDTGSLTRWNMNFELFPTLLANISTRMRVETGDNVLIGGFIVTGSQPKRVIVRAIGPALTFPDKLSDPTLELRDGNGALLRFNDDWRNGAQGFPSQETEIIATGIPPTNDLESAIVATLPANGAAYTAIVRGFDNATGIGLVEAYDLDNTVDSKLANISTRGRVQTGNNVMIAGTIVTGFTTQRVIVRAIGPSLTALGVPGAISDTALELRDGDGDLIAANDNWQTDQESEIRATGIPPSNSFEAAIVLTLPTGAAYTAIVRGPNGETGVAVVEVYGLN